MKIRCFNIKIGVENYVVFEVTKLQGFYQFFSSKSLNISKIFIFVVFYMIFLMKKLIIIKIFII